MTLRVLYRGPLASCNYGCEYCPFAKRKDSRADLEKDSKALRRFVDWVESREAPTSVFFTPWGEALIRPSYQRALARLSRMAHVERAAIQTNLSASLAWIDDAIATKVGLWATYHPDWTSRSKFVAQVAEAAERGVSISAGVVGFLPFLDEIRALRDELPATVYLWINANKRDPDYYDENAIRALEAIDPLFRTNTIRHPSRGRACRAGETAISVDGDGVMRRCHFIDTPIGNIHEPGHESALAPRPCTNDTCGCHIGYVHLDHLELADVYGDSILERVPRPAYRSSIAAAAFTARSSGPRSLNIVS